MACSDISIALCNCHNNLVTAPVSCSWTFPLLEHFYHFIEPHRKVWSGNEINILYNDT